MKSFQFKRRRGMTSIIEVVICLLLFAFALTTLLSFLGFTTKDQLEAAKSMGEHINADYFIDCMVQDVKSSSSIDISENILTLSTDEETIVYAVIDDTLYRNDEKLFDDVQNVTFSPMDDAMISVYVKLDNGDTIDFAVHE